MRVLHLSSEKSWRGGEQQIAYLIEELSSLGQENYVICRSGSSFESYCQSKSIQHSARSFSGFGIISTAIFLQNYVKKYNIDVVHMHTAKSHIVGFISLLFGNRKPFILSRRVDFVPSNSWFTKMRYNHLGIKKILCVSDAIRKIMHEYLDKGKDRSTTVYSGVDLSKFEVEPSFSLKEKYNIDKEKAVVGNTSALADHKDYFTFIDTAEELIRAGHQIHFFILGDGPMKDDIVSYVDDKQLLDSITFTGFVDQVPEWLKQFDAFLITSKTEGLGTSIIDALACEIPVVATAAGGIPELVIHEQTGLLAEVKNVSQLASYVKRILEDQTLRERLIKNGLEHVQLFSKSNTALKTLEAYQSSVGSRQ